MGAKYNGRYIKIYYLGYDATPIREYTHAGRSEKIQLSQNEIVGFVPLFSEATYLVFQKCCTPIIPIRRYHKLRFLHFS